MRFRWVWLTRGAWLTLGLLALVYLGYLTWPRPGPVGAGESAAKTGVAPPDAPPDEAGTKPIRIGWTAWADAEVVAGLVERLLERRMGYEVERVMADIGIQYQGVARGNLDLMLMAWLPVTHQNYWERVALDVVNLGPMYTRARLGWAVPNYIPREQLSSITDLRDREVQARIGGQIQGIDPGSGLMQVSERALRTYGLSRMKLVSSSGAAMTAAVARAVRRREWFVVTAWSPHWMFAKWDLRYLRDPKGALGGRERVHAIARSGFYQNYPPEVTEFLTRLFLPLKELEAAMLNASKTSVEQAVSDYIEAHPERVHYWVTGGFATDQERGPAAGPRGETP